MSIFKKYNLLSLKSIDLHEQKNVSPMDPNEILDRLTKITRLPKSEKYKSAKIMKKVFLHPGFCKLMFDPGDTFPNLNSIIPEIYQQMRKQDNIRAIINMIKTESTESFSRSHAVFLNNFITLCIEELNNDISVAKKRREDGEITRNELSEFLEDSDNYTSELQVLLKKTRKIVKDDAKDIASATKIPKEIVIASMLNCPDSIYINKYRIGYYMNAVISAIYEETSKIYGNDEGFVRYISTNAWRTLFSELFGKENLASCATMILLEGVGKNKKFMNLECVQEIWQSLIEFALYTLDSTTDEKRIQMMDLYIKRIEKMFRNKNNNELRYDLRTVSKLNYPKLFDTVSKYIKRITDIVEKVEE